MYLLEIDHTKKRVHLMLSDQFTGAESKALFDELQRRSAELEKGFHVLCDLSNLETFEHQARLQFRAVMDFCNDAGVKKVIRIIPDPLNNFGLTMMSYFHYPEGVAIITCQTLKEAAAHL